MSTKNKRYKLTEAQIKYFFGACESLVQTLAPNFAVHREVKEFKKTIPYFAEAGISMTGCTNEVTFTISRDWPESPSDKKLFLVAYHEVLHVLLYPLSDLLDSKYDSDYVNRLEHNIIYALERFMGESIQEREGGNLVVNKRIP